MPLWLWRSRNLNIICCKNLTFSLQLLEIMMVAAFFHLFLSNFCSQTSSIWLLIYFCNSVLSIYSDLAGTGMSSFDKKVCENECFWFENCKKFFRGLEVAPPSLYQNLGEPLITIAIFRFLQKQGGVLRTKNAANCDPSNFSIVLRYSGGFAAQLIILVCNAAH